MPKPRLAVQKTYKLFIGGKFVRGESGRVMRAPAPAATPAPNYCRASRKDFRDAVVAARAGLNAWSKNSGYLRGQILYRAAEMLETRRRDFEDEKVSRREVTATIDRLVYYAGWADKFAQVAGAVNPVASSHFNFTVPEPTGVVVALCADTPALLGFVAIVAPILCSGNCVIALASEANPLPALTLSEIIATSDMPAGAVNILAGNRAELAPHFATHMDVNAIVDGSGDSSIGLKLANGSAINLKRYFRRASADYFAAEAANPYWIADTTEMKTAWHPVGL